MYNFKIFYVIFTVNTKKILTEHTAKGMGKESKHPKKSMNWGKNSERQENEQQKHYTNNTETKWDWCK